MIAYDAEDSLDPGCCARNGGQAPLRQCFGERQAASCKTLSLHQCFRQYTYHPRSRSALTKGSMVVVLPLHRVVDAIDPHIAVLWMRLNAKQSLLHNAQVSRH